MIQRVTFLFLLLGMAITGPSIFAQVSISGQVTDTEGMALVGAQVSLKPSDKFAVTDLQGNYELRDVAQGNYILTMTYIGAKTFIDSLDVEGENISLSPILEEDPLALQAVTVTGSFEPQMRLESSSAVNILKSKDIQKTVPRGTADLLQSIPGTFTDASAGEVFTKVYTRGISAASEDDIGWYYLSLQEDGLPVSLVQHSYYTPELFQRTDLFTEKVEAIRGGSASITALNAPGGIYNFISRGPRDTFGGELQLSGGVQGEGNPLFKIDGVIGGPLGNNWFFNAGGHYRRDDGARNVDFVFSKGGQFRFNVIKTHEEGYLKFHGKLLDDFTNRWTGVAATDWDNPKAAFGQNFRSTALLLPETETEIPDPRRLSEGATNTFDPSRGVHAQDLSLGVDVLQDLGSAWTLRFNSKFSHKKADWQTSISNAFVSLADPTAYFLAGTDPLPIGQVIFRNAQTGNELARVNNAALFSENPGFDYLSDGRLPYDALLGAAAWYKQNEADELIGQLTLNKTLENHDITVGIASGFSDNSLFTQASFNYLTYEPNPRMMQVTLENPDQPIVELSDVNGVSNYGGLPLFINANADVTQVAAFANDRWKIMDNLHLDAGLRYENIKHKGTKDRFAPLDREGGVDENVNTLYDNGLLAPSGAQDDFDFNYGYLSYSAGLNYKFQEEAAVFARFSHGNKAPELNYYFNNFDNVPISGKGQVQKINQAEIGLKWNLTDFSFSTTVFWSELANIGITNFEFDPESADLFYTPIQFNSSRTLGLEWESSYSPIANLSFNFNGTIQDPKTKEWTIYDAAGSVDTNDDSIQDFSGQTLPFNPKLMFNLGTEYQGGSFNAFLRWQFMGKRQGNVANAFELASYSIFNAGLGYAVNEHLSADVIVTNIFNSEGLANFFGPNSFGANANSASPEFIQENPDASFVVVPVLPRGGVLKLSYRF